MVGWGVTTRGGAAPAGMCLGVLDKCRWLPADLTALLRYPAHTHTPTPPGNHTHLTGLRTPAVQKPSALGCLRRRPVSCGAMLPGWRVVGRACCTRKASISCGVCVRWGGGLPQGRERRGCKKVCACVAGLGSHNNQHCQLPSHDTHLASGLASAVHHCLKCPARTARLCNHCSNPCRLSCCPLCRCCTPDRSFTCCSVESPPPPCPAPASPPSGTPPAHCPAQQAPRWV